MLMHKLAQLKNAFSKLISSSLINKAKSNPFWQAWSDKKKRRVKRKAMLEWKAQANFNYCLRAAKEISESARYFSLLSVCIPSFLLDYCLKIYRGFNQAANSPVFLAPSEMRAFRFDLGLSFVLIVHNFRRRMLHSHLYTINKCRQIGLWDWKLSHKSRTFGMMWLPRRLPLKITSCFWMSPAASNNLDTPMQGLKAIFINSLDLFLKYLTK